ncbi:MAG: hypothetical protein J0M12_16605 [Deltaproteobacteria bacterium]|nr:hypothetical protein [Deltaproteobacteria bacterium]
MLVVPVQTLDSAPDVPSLDTTFSQIVPVRIEVSSLGTMYFESSHGFLDMMNGAPLEATFSDAHVPTPECSTACSGAGVHFTFVTGQPPTENFSLSTQPSLPSALGLLALGALALLRRIPHARRHSIA